MMLTNSPRRLRRIAGLSLAGMLAAGGLALSLPASAQDSNTKTEVHKTVKIVETDSNGKRVELEGTPEQMKQKCPGEVFTVTADASAEANKKQKAVILLCAKKGESKEEARKGLEGALGHIDSSTDMDPAMKAELKAKIQAKIDSLNSK